MKKTRFSQRWFLGTRLPSFVTTFASTHTKPGLSLFVRSTNGSATGRGARPFSTRPSSPRRSQSRKYVSAGISPFTPSRTSENAISSPGA